MKKLLVFLAAMMLLATSALAEVTVAQTIDHAKSIYMSTATGCYYARVDGGYQLFDRYGNPMSAVYSNLSAKQSGKYYEYEGEGLNYIGLLDAEGQVICAPTYGEFTTYDNGWALGYVLEPTTDANGDFKDNNNNQYNVVRTDVFSHGKVIGSLSREEYRPDYSEGVADDYFYVKQTSESGFFIDRSFNRYPVTGTFYTSTEYDHNWNTGVVTHVRTQQKAFCADSPLTEEQVTTTVWYDDDTDSLLDLKGNVIKDKVNYDSVRIYEEYIAVRLNKLYGVMDLKGNVIIEPAYSELAYDLYANGATQAAITPEGHLHFLDRSGNITAKVEYELTSSDYKGFYYNSCFAVVKNMGKVMVFTSTHGELPTKYEDFYQPQSKHQVLRVQKDGLWGAIDTAGNTVIPFIHRSCPEISQDGLVLVGIDTDRKYHTYILSTGEEKPAAPAIPEGWTETKQSDDGSAPVLADGAWECACGAINTGKFCGFCGAKQPEATPTPTPAPAAEGAWTCDCGSNNTGKFCPVCGAKQPEPTPAPAANDGSWDCTCGSHNTGKFCPECGSKKPEAPVEPQCSGCGYKPEGAAPKFCPECGTKF